MANLITAYGGFAGFPAKLGPYQCAAAGGALFVLIANTTTDFLEMWRSFDGVTWTQLDSANAPAFDPFANNASSVYDDATNKIYIAFVNSFALLSFVAFDCIAGTWGTLDAGGPLVDGSGFPFSYAGEEVLVQTAPGSGDFVIVFAGLDNNTAITVAAFVTYTLGSMTWNSIANISSGLGGGDDVFAVVAGASGRVHVLTNDSGGGNLRHWTITAGVLSSYDAVWNDVTGESSTPQSIGTAVYDSASNTLLFPAVALSDGDLHAFVATEAAVPSWTDTAMGEPFVQTPAVIVLLGAIIIGGTLQIFRAIGPSPFSVSQHQDSGGGWNTGSGTIEYTSTGTLFSISVGLVDGAAALVVAEDPAGGTFPLQMTFVGGAAPPATQTLIVGGIPTAEQVNVPTVGLASNTRYVVY